LLANAMCQMLLFRLTRRVRQQAGSYRPYAPHQPAYFDAPRLAFGGWRVAGGGWRVAVGVVRSAFGLRLTALDAWLLGGGYKAQPQAHEALASRIGSRGLAYHPPHSPRRVESFSMPAAGFHSELIGNPKARALVLKWNCPRNCRR